MANIATDAKACKKLFTLSFIFRANCSGLIVSYYDSQVKMDINSLYTIGFCFFQKVI